QYTRPAGVALRFQVCEYSVEPSVPNSCWHLFTKNDPRAQLSGEPQNVNPELAARVSEAFAFSRATEGRARDTGTPNRSVCRPSCEPESGGPPGKPVEEMQLCVTSEFIGIEFGYVGLENFAAGNVAGGDEVARPLATKRINVRVEDGRGGGH